MEMVDENRRDALIETFKTYMKDFHHNIFKIYDILEEMIDVDPNMVIPMWYHLVSEKEDVARKDMSSNGVFNAISVNVLSILYSITTLTYKKISFEELVSQFLNNEHLVEIVFGESTLVNDVMVRIVQRQLIKGDTKMANKLLTLVYNNRLSIDEPNCFGEFLGDVINLLGLDISYEECYDRFNMENLSPVNPIIQKFVLSWINKLEEETDKAKAMIAFMKIV